MGLPPEKVDMRSDGSFCDSREMKDWIRRRRRHADCGAGGEVGLEGKMSRLCLVFEGTVCPVQGRSKGKEILEARKEWRRFVCWWSALIHGEAGCGSGASVLGLLWLLMGIIVVVFVALIERD